MHPGLISLPDILLQNLGCTSSLNELALLLQSHTAPIRTLRQHQNGNPYNVSTPYGIDLTLQCTSPKAANIRMFAGRALVVCVFQ